MGDLEREVRDFVSALVAAVPGVAGWRFLAGGRVSRLYTADGQPVEIGEDLPASLAALREIHSLPFLPSIRKKPIPALIECLSAAELPGRGGEARLGDLRISASGAYEFNYWRLPQWTSATRSRERVPDAIPAHRRERQRQ